MLALGPPAITGCSGILPTSASACLIDWVLAKATVATAPKSGYYFANTTTGGPPTLGYVVGGSPAAPNQTGVRGFCSTEEGVIRYIAGPAGAPVVTVAACVAFTALQ